MQQHKKERKTRGKNCIQTQNIEIGFFRLDWTQRKRIECDMCDNIINMALYRCVNHMEAAQHTHSNTIENWNALFSVFSFAFAAQLKQSKNVLWVRGLVIFLLIGGFIQLFPFLFFLFLSFPFPLYFRLVFWLFVNNEPITECRNNFINRIKDENRKQSYAIFDLINCIHMKLKKKTRTNTHAKLFGNNKIHLGTKRQPLNRIVMRAKINNSWFEFNFTRKFCFLIESFSFVRKNLKKKF